MRKRLIHNLGLKLASLVLAFFLWFLVVQINDPIDSETFSNVPIKLINTELLEQEGKMYEVLDNTDTARVTVYAPKSVIGQVRKSDIVAEADMSKLTDINTIAVNYYVENVTVDVVDGNREFVQLSVEARKSDWIRLISNTVGEVAEGYMISGTTLDQTNIEITGPESAVDQVSYAAVDIDVTDAITDLSANVDIQLYDKDGNVVGDKNITKSANSAYMKVEVLATKEVPIELKFAGEPAEGYLATGVAESTLSSVVIAGRPSVLSNISAITIPGEDLDITGATGSLEQTINLREYLPDTIRWADKTFNGRVMATVYVEPIAVKSLMILPENIGLVNVPEDLIAEYTTEAEGYELVISGLAEHVEPVQAQTITGQMDIAAYMEMKGIEELKPGVHEVPVTFLLPQNISADSDVIIPIRFMRAE